MNLEKELKALIKTYQCPGCCCGMFEDGCYEKSFYGISCKKHVPATYISIIGKIFLGMPKGFNRLGECNKMPIEIFEEFNNEFYDELNIPVWKYFDGKNTIIKGLKPRINQPFLHIIKGNCIDKIICYEVTNSFIEQID